MAIEIIWICRKPGISNSACGRTYFSDQIIKLFSCREVVAKTLGSAFSKTPSAFLISRFNLDALEVSLQHGAYLSDVL